MSPALLSFLQSAILKLRLNFYSRLNMPAVCQKKKSLSHSRSHYLHQAIDFVYKRKRSVKNIALIMANNCSTGVLRQKLKKEATKH